ncbi:DUF1178 family protein [Roseomonas marmotae]|uniref:DUF1178 family protein n=1 Tax=Roseomonas marmotae TaxID=2768161 RepID=A0ABS3KH08_9PROT|nr:DUF1178 family protein [Roseomonas marmotae]MBO1076749.1 DUF1178 family protein [Roseomonas marmotae]QTI77993.1 DUF1178 family protein [Roseomonas marmotae]
MIHYQLRCDQGHEFDGWYRDSTAFEKLADAGLVECPVCGGSKVTRALMAPAIPKKGRTKAAEPAEPVVPQQPAPPPEAGAQQQAAAGPIPAQMVALLQRMRAEVEKNCDYVGSGFAEEARKMHRGETEFRGIYGEASDTDAEALRDEGIDIARLPWVPRADG